MEKALSTAALAFAFVSAFIAFAGFANANQNSNSSASQNSAETIYLRRCASCHGKDGRARTFKAKFNDARDLTNWQWQEAVSDEQLYNSIMNGRGKMPAFSKKLSESQVDALVLYVRGLKK